MSKSTDLEMWDRDNLTTLLAKLSLKTCMEYLISGYIKQNTTTEQFEIYSVDLQQLSVNYLGNIFYRFNPKFMDTTKMKLMNEYKIEVQGTDSDIWIQATVLIDLPIPINNDEININLNIKIHAPGLPNGHYFIGIVHDKYTVFGDTVWMETAKCFNKHRSDIYGVCGNNVIDEFSQNGEINADNIIWNGHRGLGDTVQDYAKYCETNKESKLVRYNSDDIINIAYDGKSKQLTLSKYESKELICSFEIAAPTRKDIKYFYPAISLRDAGDFVEILN